MTHFANLLLKVPNLTLDCRNLSTSIVSQDNASSGRAKGSQGNGGRNDGPATVFEEAFTGSTPLDFGSVPNWTFDQYRSECAGLMVVKHFDAMAVDGKNLVMYDCSCFERDTPLSV